MHRVFAIDALASSHPLSSEEGEINKPEQISELFDAISYSKVRLSALFSLTLLLQFAIQLLELTSNVD